MKNEVNKQELKEYNDLARRVHKAGTSAPVLSRAQKKYMLATIVPRESFWQRFHLSTVAFASLLLVFSSVVIAMSQPGDYLYAVKRKLEDARSSVQPSYDNVLLNRRNEEIEKLKNSGASEDHIEQAENEKQEIEQRKNSRDRVKSEDGNTEETEESESNEQNEANQRKSTAEDDSQSQLEDESTSSNNSSTNSSSEDQQKAKEEACKNALDQRKAAGENIDSDLYKQCKQ